MHIYYVIIPIFVLNHGTQALKVKAKRSCAFFVCYIVFRGKGPAFDFSMVGISLDMFNIWRKIYLNIAKNSVGT